jgi:hypothetical protein
MGEANVIPRRCTLARLVLSSRLTISILSLGLFMISLSGCVLPVGPRFEDPPAAENVPPFVKSTTPLQGSTVTAVNNAQLFSVTFTDLNPSDQLHVRWIVEYPPFKSGITHLLQADRDISPPVNGQVVDYTDMKTVSCFNGFALADQHAVTVFISDQPLWNAGDEGAPSDPEQGLTQNQVKSVMAQANWTLNLPCH